MERWNKHILLLYLIVLCINIDASEIIITRQSSNQKTVFSALPSHTANPSIVIKSLSQYKGNPTPYRSNQATSTKYTPYKDFEDS